MGTTKGSPLCTGDHYSPVCFKVWTGPTFARCHFHDRSFPESQLPESKSLLYLYIDEVKVSLANISLWLATAAATKASLLLLYYRLFSPSRRFRVAVYIGTASVFCQWFSLTLTSIFQCQPVAAFWNRRIQGAKCIDLPRFTIVSGVLNLLTDVLILCLPIPMVWGLHTTNIQKVTLTGLFLLGIL